MNETNLTEIHEKSLIKIIEYMTFLEKKLIVTKIPCQKCQKNPLKNQIHTQPIKINCSLN